MSHFGMEGQNKYRLMMWLRDVYGKQVLPHPVVIGGGVSR